MSGGEKAHTVVIGAGLIGVTTAYFLSRNKNRRVTILEKYPEAACLTSKANAGALCPSHTNPQSTPKAAREMIWSMLGLRSFPPTQNSSSPFSVNDRPNSEHNPFNPTLAKLKFREVWPFGIWFLYAAFQSSTKRAHKCDALYELSNKGIHLTLDITKKHQLDISSSSGLLGLCSCAERFAQERDRANQMTNRGWPTRIIVPSEAIQMDPERISPYKSHIVGVVYDESDITSNSRNFALGLAKVCQNQGVNILYNTECSNLIIDKTSGKVEGVKLSDGRMIKADDFVVCMGPDTQPFLKASNVKLNLPIGLMKGHSITVGVSEDQLPKLGIIFSDSYTYITPFHNIRQVRLTTGADFVGNDRSIDGDRIMFLKRTAEQILNAKFDMNSLSPWVGIRPMSPDGLPYIGRVPHHKNLYINSGHGALGWTLCTGAGKLITDIIEQSDTHLSSQHSFRVTRFSPWTQLLRNITLKDW